MHVLLLLLGLIFLSIQNQIIAQPLQIDHRFGMEVQFPDGWTLLSEDLYSSMHQRQLFASEREEVTVYVENVFMLSELNKEEWAYGVEGYPLSFADSVVALKKEKWMFEAPEFRLSAFTKYPSGVSVFYAEASSWNGYVLFISREGAFIRLSITASKNHGEPDMKQVKNILSTLTFAAELPSVPDDPYILADRMYVIEQNYEQALLFYELVPETHPKYADAQRTIGYGIYGNQFENWATALLYVQEAYRVSPGDPGVLEDLGRVYLKAGRVEEGIEFLEKAGTRTARKVIEDFR